ncbi:MAG: hypothetical protein V7765_05805 [Oleispira sp.]
MSIASGKYFAVPVSSTDPEFDIEFIVDPEYRIFSAQRMTEDDKPQAPVDEIEQIKAKAKEGMASFKKGGLKGAFGFAKKLAEETMKDDKQKLEEAKEANFKDPMDPIHAFALDTQSGVSYEPIHSLEDKHKDTNLFQFRSDSGYGVLEPLENGVLREISFSYPSHEYAEKKYENQHVGHSVHDWRREDDVLHHMRVYYLSQDKSKADAAAKAASMATIKNDHFSVDLTSTRAAEKTRFRAPDLRIDKKSGDVSLTALYAWFLPRKTQQGRQIQYNWDALRVRVTQGDTLVKRIVCWSSSKEMDYIKSQCTSMELMNGGYIGELEAGKYELRLSIYNDEMMVYPFEVIKTVSTDNRTAVETYYTLKTPADNFAKLKYTDESFQLDIEYPLCQLVTEMGSVEEFEVVCKIMRDGKTWPDYEVSEFDGSNMQTTITVRNQPNWASEPTRLQIPFGSQAEYRGRESVPNGTYTAHISIDGTEKDQIVFEIKDGTLVTDNVSFPTELALADFDFPEEHNGHLFPLNK